MYWSQKKPLSSLKPFLAGGIRSPCALILCGRLSLLQTQRRAAHMQYHLLPVDDNSI